MASNESGDPAPKTARPRVARTPQISVYGVSISWSVRAAVSSRASHQPPCRLTAQTTRSGDSNA